MSKSKYSMELMVAERSGGRRQFLLGFVAAIALVIVIDLAFMMYRVSVAKDHVVVGSGEVELTWPTPPPYQEVAKVARYVVHISDWASIATISTAAPISGFPFANIVSVSDGPIKNTSGTPYIYITHMDLSGHDLVSDARATMSFSEAQSSYCNTSGFDPEDPRCARILISGSIVQLKNGTSEADFARQALFTRHPVMADWPTGHKFFFAKLDISHIYVLDFFGGAAEVSVEEYYKANPF